MRTPHVIIAALLSLSFAVVASATESAAIADSVAFNAANGELTVVTAKPSGARVRESSGGHIEVTIDGCTFSSNSRSGAYDHRLSGATTATLQRVSALGSDLYVDGCVTSKDLTFAAGRIYVNGLVQAPNVDFNAAKFINFDQMCEVQVPGGRISAQAEIMYLNGRLIADGAVGGAISLKAGYISSQAVLSANGLKGDGGAVVVDYTGKYVETARATLRANGGLMGKGGDILVRGEPTATLFTSGHYEARGGDTAAGGTIHILGKELALAATRIDASGFAGGGTVLVGGDYQGRNSEVLNAERVEVNAASEIHADAIENGNGGKVIVWSNGTTLAQGKISARGGRLSGNGGFIECSGKEDLGFKATADAGAPNGKAGTLLLDPRTLTVALSGASLFTYRLFDAALPDANSLNYGTTYAVLPNGNIVIGAPFSSPGGISQAGVFYLFNGATGAILGSLAGDNASDNFGNVIKAVGATNNFVVSNFRDTVMGQSQAGSVYLMNGVTGAVIGTPIQGSVMNQITGATLNVLGDEYFICDFGATIGMDAYAGQTIHINGATGAEIGTRLTGSAAFVAFSNGGVVQVGSNFVVTSQSDNGGRGTVKMFNNAGTVLGMATGSTTTTALGSPDSSTPPRSGIFVLGNGNYVINSPVDQGNGRGEVVLCNGANGNAIATLTGTADSDSIGSGGLVPVGNNYVICSPNVNGAGTDRGRVALHDGTTGALIGAAVVGAADNDFVGQAFPADFRDGHLGITVIGTNYAIASPAERVGANSAAGTVRLVNGATGAVISTVSGAFANDQVGGGSSVFSAFGGVFAVGSNYVIASPSQRVGANSAAGSVGLYNGTTGTLIGSAFTGDQANDQIGNGGVTVVGGNYIVNSYNSTEGAVMGAGQVALINGTSGAVIGTPLMGSFDFDLFGAKGSGGSYSNGVVAVGSNYAILSANVSTGAGLFNRRGSITLVNGTTGVQIGSTIVGEENNDNLGSDGATICGGNLVVKSVNDYVGAVNVGSLTVVNSTTGALIGKLSGQQSGDYSQLNVVPISGDNFLFTAPVDDYGIASNVGSAFVVVPTLTNSPYALLADTDLALAPSAITNSTNAGTAVVLQANTDVIVNAAITSNNPSGNGGNLTLSAGRSVLINANITTDNGALTLLANDTVANGVVDAQRPAGSATINVASGAVINTGTGALTMTLGTGPTTNNAKTNISLGGNITSGATTFNGPTALGASITINAGSWGLVDEFDVNTFTLTATNGVNVFSGGKLTGAGTVTGLVNVASGGTLAPGSDPGLMTVNGSVTLASGSTFAVKLNGSTAALNDRIAVNGAMDLGGATLAPNFAYIPGVDSFVVIDNDAADAVTGTFNALAEGGIIAGSGGLFSISYVGGSGNDVTFSSNGTGSNGSPPTDIGLSATTIAENSAAGTAVGTLTTTDPDVGDTSFVYALVTGTGDTDNALFAIVGDSLKVVGALDHETKATLNIRVRSTDPGGNTFNKVFAITVTDVADSTFSISGQILKNGNTAVTGATVSDGTRSATTDANGNYTITDVPNGDYTVTPTLAGSTFTPATRAVTIANSSATGKDFAANSSGGSGGGGGTPTSTDTDGDGFSDVIEVAAGTSPSNAADTPTGEAVTETLPLPDAKLSIKLNFAKAASDAVALGATLLLSDGFDVNGKKITIAIGGLAKTFTLDAKGGAKSGGDTVGVKSKGTAARVAKFAAKFGKGSFSDEFSGNGLTNADGTKNVDIPLMVVIDGNVFSKTQKQTYTGKAGKSGATKDKK